MIRRVCVFPFPVEVMARVGAAVVAEGNTVGVEHREDFEFVGTKELEGVGLGEEQGGEDALDDVGGDGFTGVHSGGD